MSNTSVVILSGGMDSATLLWGVVKMYGDNVGVLTFDYGQRHSREIECAKQLCDHEDVKSNLIVHKIVKLDVLNSVAPSCLTRAGWAVPHGMYDDENMKQTVVPNRNMVMLSIAISFGLSIDAYAVYYGAHAGDHTIYPDCRPEFIGAIDKAAKLCDWKSISVIAPYQRSTKGEIVREGTRLGVPYEMTHTCYEGSGVPCGKCGSCTEREEAFRFAGRADPLVQRRLV